MYFGQMIRRDNIQRILIDGQIDGKRCRGRPRTEWTTNVCKWTELTSYAEIARKAQDRRVLRSMAVILQQEDDTE